MGERVTVYETTTKAGPGASCGRRLCRLAAGERADRAARGADPQGHGAAHARVSRPHIKLPPIAPLPLGAALAVVREQDRFAVAPAGLRAGESSRAARHVEHDFVAVAERFLGTPYLWGGKTSLGLDCSGLVQVALDACGIACPRDSDMQEAALGTPIAHRGNPRRGDLVFWKGHVAIVRDPRAAACQCVSHGGRRRAARRRRSRASGSGQRRDERATASVADAAIDHIGQRLAALEGGDLLAPRRARSRRDRCRRHCAARASPSDATRTGCPAGSGSVPNTSSVAARQRAVVEAARMSSSTCSPPRPALMTTGPPSLPSRASCANVLRLRMPRVAGVSGNRHTSISVRARKSGELALAGKTGDAGNRLRRAAPARDVEADAGQHLRGVAPEHAEPHDADAQRTRGPLQLRRPDAVLPGSPRDSPAAGGASAHASRRTRSCAASRSSTATRTSGTSGRVGSATTASTPAPRLKITSRLGKPQRAGRRLPHRRVAHQRRIDRVVRDQRHRAVRAHAAEALAPARRRPVFRASA